MTTKPQTLEEKKAKDSLATVLPREFHSTAPESLVRTEKRSFINVIATSTYPKKLSLPNLGSYLFVSADDDVIGSIYFEHGRIRLLHTHGPEVSIRESTRYEVDTRALEIAKQYQQKQIRLFERYGSASKSNKKKILNKLQLLNINMMIDVQNASATTTSSPTRLYEPDVRHISRGTSKTQEFTQHELTLILKIVVKLPAIMNPDEKNNYFVNRINFYEPSLLKKFNWSPAYLKKMLKPED